jgi:EAL domain-containing protein (putative c-di-GMP-specific phosphodiesterase class I)
MLGEHEIAPVPWLGVAVAPGDGADASALRQSADLAAAYRRRQGTAQITFASPELNAQSYQRLTLGSQLRGAAQRDELRLHYQPKVDIASGRITGIEALVRWQHPDHGLLPPAKFIPLSEELGLTASIGEWVLEKACRDVAGWTRAGLGEIAVAVNVSQLQVTAGDLGRVVRQALFDSGMSARQLVIELTESMLMGDMPHCLSLMHDLKAIGVALSIDDFGTGYSSLAYLKKFPIDELKIDRAFIADLPGSATGTALVRTVIELGHSLGMSVTAEGVEKAEQLACLTHLGCDLYQGFLFGRPVPARELLERLATE